MARRFSDSSTESRRKESPSIRRRFLLSSSFIRWRYKKMLCRVLKLNNCKRKKLFFFLLRFRPWCTRGNAGVVDRPTRKSPPIDPFHCTTPFWFICPGLNVVHKQSDHENSPPSLLSCVLYYITFSNEIQSKKILNQHIFLWQHQWEKEKDGA